MDAYEMDFLKLYAQHDENSKYWCKYRSLILRFNRNLVTAIDHLCIYKVNFFQAKKYDEDLRIRLHL